ncbi:voltage dependent anion channel 1 [Actinidia rufa]|uniref:Voltage dependent anion channel 1 n=1 Tax=Actinidia rufa TaxID=165716 RepID=A0A7J0H872_9ERIC|nr:voltage dependent anion channel 1 [Actinidia rufa]
MAKSKNHTAHNQSYEAHKNGIKKPRKHRHTSTKGLVPFVRWLAGLTSYPFFTCILEELSPLVDSVRCLLEVQYLHDYGGISSSIKLTANPNVNFSCVVGTNVGGLGTDVSLDNKTGCFTKCNTRLSFCNADLTASLTVNDKGDTLNASYHPTVSPLTNTAVGWGISHSFSTNENTLTVGTQHYLDRLTMLKALVNNVCKASAWRSRHQGH